MAIIYCTELKSDEVEKPSIPTQKPRCYTSGHLSRTKPKVKREQGFRRRMKRIHVKNKKTKKKHHGPDCVTSYYASNHERQKE